METLTPPPLALRISFQSRSNVSCSCSFGAISAKQLPQFLKAARPRRPDAGDGHIHRIRDFGITWFGGVEIEQIDQLAATLGHLIEGALQRMLVFDLQQHSGFVRDLFIEGFGSLPRMDYGVSPPASHRHQPCR